MKKTLLAVVIAALALGGFSEASADGPVLGTCRYTWGQPTLNVDGSPLVDLKQFNVYMSIAPGTPGVKVAVIAAPMAAPAEGATYTWGCSGSIVDGQKYGTVSAVNAQGVESARSNEFPFVMQKPVQSGAPASLSVGPHN